MKKTLFLFFIAVLCGVCAKAQSSQEGLIEADLKHQKDSIMQTMLIKAGATNTQIQQFRTAVTTYSTQLRSIYLDTTITRVQRYQKVILMIDQKDIRYKEILGEQTYIKYLKFVNAPAGVDPFL